ncbi:MAG: KGG domain-containing protein [Ramlibacter sp.]
MTPNNDTPQGNMSDVPGPSGQPKKGSSNRGFASMDPKRQREIASEGGRAAHEKGTAHEFTSEEARAAGRKGGQARSESNRARKSTS